MECGTGERGILRRASRSASCGRRVSVASDPCQARRRTKGGNKRLGRHHDRYSRPARDRQQVLMAELQHRTRNLRAVVHAIANRTARSSSSLETFRAEFESRLHALPQATAKLNVTWVVNSQDVESRPPYPDPSQRRIAAAALTLLNDAI